MAQWPKSLENVPFVTKKMRNTIQNICTVISYNIIKSFFYIPKMFYGANFPGNFACQITPMLALLILALDIIPIIVFQNVLNHSFILENIKSVSWFPGICLSDHSLFIRQYTKCLSPTLSQLTLKTQFRGGYYYYHCFTHEQTKAWKG